MRWIRDRAVESGVYYGWFVVGSCFLAAAVLFGTNFSFGVFLSSIQSEYGQSRAGVSALYSLQTFVLYAGAAALGLFVDRYGARRFLWVGTVLLSGGLASAAFLEPLPAVAVSFGVVAALGLSILHLIAYATVPRWFGRRRGLASGLATSGLGIGMFVVQPVAAQLVGRLGWRGAYLVLAVGFFAVLGLATVFVADGPESLGVDASHEFPEGSAPATDGGVDRTVGDVARSPAFVLVFVGWICIYTTLFTLLAHLVPYAASAGIRWAGVWALSLVGLVSVGSRILLGAVADRIGSVRVFVASSVAMGVMLLALPAARTPALLFGFAALFAVGFGGNGALLSVLPAELFGVANINAVFGLTLSAFAVSALVAPPLAGLSFDVLGTYAPAFTSAGALGVFGAALVAVAGRLEGAI